MTQQPTSTSHFSIATTASLYMGREGNLNQGTLQVGGVDKYSYAVTAYSNELAQARVIPGPFDIKPRKENEVQLALAGTWILSLHVRDNEKKTVLQFEKGRWVKAPQTDEEHAIVETLKHMFPPAQPKPQPIPAL